MPSFFQHIVRIFCILTLPILWIVTTTPWKAGPHLLTPLENKTIDLRFQFIGERPAPIKIFYLYIDSQSLKMMGERPWNLDFFADITQIIFKIGQAKALGFHFVLSDKPESSTLLNAQRFQEAQIHLASALFAFAPKIVLGAEYTENHLEYLQDGNISRWGPFPYLRKGYINPYKNPYPQMPAYPLIGPNWGRVGFLEYDFFLSAGTTPRWMPLFSQVQGGSHALSILTGMRDAGKMPLDAITFDEEDYILMAPSGEEISRMSRIEHQTFYAFGLELFLAYHGLDNSCIQITDQALNIVPNDKSTALPTYSIPLTDKQCAPITWFSKWDNDLYNPSMSIAQLYQHFSNLKTPGTRAYDISKSAFETMKDAIVLVGGADSHIDDFITTPFDNTPVPSVTAQGNFIKTIASQQYLKYLSNAQNSSIIFGFSLLLTTLSELLKKRKILKNALLILLFMGYPLFTFWIFKNHYTVWPLCLPLFSAISCALMDLFFHILSEKKQKNRIKELFGTYVSPTVVNELIIKKEDPKLGGSDQFITAFFSDIQHFSQFSEKLPPSDLVKLMNEYFEAMTAIIQKENGTLDKYIGDAIVAIFGAPLHDTWHGLSACIAACHIQKKQAELDLIWSRQGNRWPKSIHGMQTRIGINSGFATVGNMGSSHRFNYTMMGDHVNLAARAEFAGKFFGTATTVTEHTYKEAIHKADICLFRRLGPTLLPGKTQPVELYELVDLKDHTPPKLIDSVDHYEKALKAYYNRDWGKALKLINKSITLEADSHYYTPINNQTPPKILKNYILKAQKNPPADNWKALWIL